MSIAKALIVQPRPCPFCGGIPLELRCITFRHWNFNCLNTDCLCKGPDGKNPDQAVVKWNSLTKCCIKQRKYEKQLAKDFQNPAIPKKIWKAARSLKTFTFEEITRISECHQETVNKYLSLLEENEYLSIESQKSSNSTLKSTYRCIKPRTVKAPSWIGLQLSTREYQVYRQEKKSMKWTKIQAVTE